MATLEYSRPNGDMVSVEIVDWQINSRGELAATFEDRTVTYLSSNTEWVIRDE